MCCGRDLRVSRDAGGKRLQVDSHGEQYDLAVDEILLGAGRTPNVEALALDVAGVQYDSQGVQVNDRLQTTNRRIYAAGDVCSRYKFTHAADAMARIVIRNALFFGRAKASALVIPWCTYTDPEIAHVGLSPREARERGIAVETIVQEFKHVDRAVLDGDDAGLLKVHVRAGSDRILGATIVARRAGEMISEITLAITAGLGLGAIAKTIHPYPTESEAVRRAADAHNRIRLTPRLKRLFEKWFAWTR
jgi:pyruvate/2-oxoglutarate dehydrogenase complex dihydrolipoamide dehydrogenase (E3) component